jgi:PGM1 C-terminal domain
MSQVKPLFPAVPVLPTTATKKPEPPSLASLSDRERNERFAALQQKLGAVWGAIGKNEEGEAIVVVPSRDVRVFDEPPTESQAYEERLLFLLLLLREPRLRLIYVTSLPISEAIVDYYLGLLEDVIPSDARSRLFLVPVRDGSRRSLTAKLLERPRLLERIRALIPRPDLCHLVPYATTALERDLALVLGIPMYAADPRHCHYGTKSGGRSLFAAAGVPHPLGEENITSSQAAVQALRRMRAARPGIEEALIKLNDGVGGKGNALIDLRELPAPGAPDEQRSLQERIEAMSLDVEAIEPARFLSELEEHGGVVEERIRGWDLRSPSVQLQITPGGVVELLSTHDQMLGGASGQKYEGCRFPADPAYASLISEQAEKVGRMLAREGVLGRFALDFVAVRDEGGWNAYAIEINLRKGGTTHPFLTLQFLTDGIYDPRACSFTAPSGLEKFFVATDHLQSPSLRALALEDLFDALEQHGLQFDHRRQTGVVFHMLSGLTELGQIGLTAVGDSPQEAESVYRHATSVLIAEAQAAAEPPLVAAA